MGGRSGYGLPAAASCSSSARCTLAFPATMLPVSLFGIAIAAAELPEMSSYTGGEEETRAKVRQRLNGGLRHIAFFVIPSAVAFLTLGDVIAA